MKKRFNVDGMTCASCQSHVDKAVREVPGVLNCNVNLLKNFMDVEYDPDLVNDNQIEEAVENAGYKAYTKERITIKKNNKALKRLLFSIIFLILLMYFSMGVMMWNFPAPKIFNMEECPLGFSLIQLVLVLPIIALNFGYFTRGFKALFKNPTMDSLIAVGAASSFLYSIYLVIRIAFDLKDSNMYHMSLYFEAAGMVLVFVSIGKYLEDLSKKRTMKSLESLFSLAPKEAIILEDNQEKKISAENVQIGQRVVVKKGSLIPVDGCIVKGSGAINEANITGESIPVYKKKKDSVYSSTILSSGYIELEATKVGEDTTFGQILKLVDEASNSKAPISKLADKISGIFVPTIFIISIVVFIINFLIIKFGNLSYETKAFETAFNYAITVVVIACPCALGLATPVAVMVGTGKGASSGLIIKNAEILEKTGKIDTIVFDKTGTLTIGKPRVMDCTIDEETLDVIYSMEKRSEHPLALAVIEYASKKAATVALDSFEAMDGVGLVAEYKNSIYKIGNKKLIASDSEYSELESSGMTILFVTKNDDFIGYISILDDVKNEAKETIEELNKLHIKTIMLTGDNQKTANAIAKKIGITSCIAECLPKDKAKAIKTLMEEGHRVAMVGDGVNDSIALATADLGIALGGGSDVASEASDIVLVRNNLFDVLNAIRLSKRVLLTIKLGLFWAFIYNAICVVLASGLFYHITKGSFVMKPEYGSIAMSISSVSVVLNALSINLFKMKGTRKEEIIMKTIVIKVDGMMCKHCKAHVEEACKSVLGVVDAVASLENKNVTVECNDTVSIDALKASIVDAGYEVIE